MSQYDPLDYRIRSLPLKLRRAREKVKRLEDEARRYGFKDLLTDECNTDPPDDQQQYQQAANA